MLKWVYSIETVVPWQNEKLKSTCRLDLRGSVVFSGVTSIHSACPLIPSGKAVMLIVLLQPLDYVLEGLVFKIIYVHDILSIFPSVFITTTLDQMEPRVSV